MEYWFFEKAIRPAVTDIDRKVQKAVEMFRERVDSLLMPDINSRVSGFDNAISLIQKKIEELLKHMFYSLIS